MNEQKMARKISAAAERALARIANGESHSDAAKAEGVLPVTITRIFDKYSHDVGVIVGQVAAKSGDKITATALTNVSMRPDLAASYLRHIKPLPELPSAPAGWKPTQQQQAKFWLGYYQGFKK